MKGDLVFCTKVFLSFGFDDDDMKIFYTSQTKVKTFISFYVIA